MLSSINRHTYTLNVAIFTLWSELSPVGIPLSGAIHFTGTLASLSNMNSLSFDRSDEHANPEI